MAVVPRCSELLSTFTILDIIHMQYFPTYLLTCEYPQYPGRLGQPFGSDWRPLGIVERWHSPCAVEFSSFYGVAVAKSSWLLNHLGDNTPPTTSNSSEADTVNVSTVAHPGR